MEDGKNVLCGPTNIFKINESSFGRYILNSLKRGGDRVALINGLTGDSITYRELLQKSINFAKSLCKMGFKKGDVLCISSENRFEFAVTTYAVIYIGGIVTTLNTSYTIDEIKHAFSISKPRFAVYSTLVAGKIKQVSSELGNIQHHILFGNEQLCGTILYNDLVSKDEDVEGFIPEDVNSSHDVMVILYSSGTTGLPKGVLLTHSNFLNMNGTIKWVSASTNRLPGQTTVFSLAPWFHTFGFYTITVYVCLNFKYVFGAKFEEESFLRIIQDYKVNIALVVPPLVLFLAKHPLVDKYDMSSLKELFCTSAPLSGDLQEITTKRLNLDCIRQGFGMTEVLLVLLDVSNANKAGSSGTVLPGIKAKVASLDTGKALGPFQEGELCFKGNTIMKGYIGPTAPADAFDKNGWLHTGDVCYYDSDQQFYIIDRVKELIKYKGYQVPPAELEAILLKHEEVKDAAVIGLPDTKSGELPLAFVVRQPNARVTEEELKAFVSDKVSPIKRLRGGVKFIDEIPKNPSGKILRRYLKNTLTENVNCKL